MRKEEMICIICPNGCDLVAEVEDTKNGMHVKAVHGFLCGQGKDWAAQELENPERTLTTNVLSRDGDIPLVSVRTDRPVSRSSIPAVMAFIKRMTVDAPVAVGDVLWENPAGVICRIIATRDCGRK